MNQLARPLQASPATLHGPLLLGDGRIRFRLWAPNVRSMQLRLGTDPDLPMAPLADGWFEVEAAAVAGDSYSFVMPDGLAVPDPASRRQKQDVHGPSMVVNHANFPWMALNWKNRPWHEAVVYEMHVGVAGGFVAARQQVKRLAELGVTALELMPVADFPGGRNWGYDGVLPFAPDSIYGSPDDLRALVDAAHAEGLMIILDVVYNHFGPDGAYLHAYAKDFFDEGVHTPWGAAIDFKRGQVQAFFVENALMWLNDYRFDGLRFDAVHAISPGDFLPVLAASIRQHANGPVHLILENEDNRSSLLGGPSAGLFDAQWADDWHHCVHVLLTGESEGYYGSFQNAAEQLATAMAEGFVFQGQISPHSNKPRGEPSAALPSTAFVICLQNHDQIGNRAMGERLTKLAHADALSAATALLLLSPTIPLLFMGEEYGATAPFLFFTDHNDELAVLVREGRRKEFEHFEAFRDESRREQIPDPNAALTFQSSAPVNVGELAFQTSAFYQAALNARRRHVMPGIPDCKSLGARALTQSAVEGAWQLGTGSELSIIANFGDKPVPVAIPRGDLVFASNATKPASEIPARTTWVFATDPA